MKHSKKKSCSKKQDRLEPASLNVTQAAVHKERWREEITHKKIKKILLDVSVIQIKITMSYLLQVSHNNAEVQSRDKPGLSKAYLQVIFIVLRVYQKVSFSIGSIISFPTFFIKRMTTTV